MSPFPVNSSGSSLLWTTPIVFLSLIPFVLFFFVYPVYWKMKKCSMPFLRLTLCFPHSVFSYLCPCSSATLRYTLVAFSTLPYSGGPGVKSAKIPLRLGLSSPPCGSPHRENGLPYEGLVDWAFAMSPNGVLRAALADKGLIPCACLVRNLKLACPLFLSFLLINPSFRPN